jgi:hypothetical protein
LVAGVKPEEDRAVFLRRGLLMHLFCWIKDKNCFREGEGIKKPLKGARLA